MLYEHMKYNKLGSRYVGALLSVLSRKKDLSIVVQVQLSGRLLTVFSSSHYCGGTNEAAAVLVDSGKLRLIKLDTK